MEATVEQPAEYEDEKMSSLNHSELQSRLAFLFMSSYRQKYSIFTELDLEFASGKTRPDLCIFPKRQMNWMTDEIIVHDVPLVTIEILSPEQSLNSLIERIYQKHFPAGVKAVWLIVPSLQIVSILLPNRQQLNFTEGVIADPESGLQLNLADIFEG